MTDKLWPLDDLASVGDLAKQFGVSPGCITRWTGRYSDFPQPLVTVAVSTIYSRRQVIEWRVQHLARKADLRDQIAQATSAQLEGLR